MKIGIAIPNKTGATSARLLVDWAIRAQERGFCSVAVSERLCYPGHDPLLTLAAAATATDTIDLCTNIIIGPLRTAEVLARQAETLASLSAGRFTLGLATGVRADDFSAAGRDFATRSADFDQQLESLHKIWSERDASADGPPAGVPAPIHLRVGGISAAAVRRAVRWADGWTAPGVEPEQVVPVAAQVRRCWSAAGRSGRPYLVAMLRFWLGDDVAAEADAFVRDFFAVLGAGTQAYAAATPRTAAHIRRHLAVLEDGGFDEVIFHPTAARLSQVDRLADIVL
jgi:alkanesulfonate monooxygenase SsuD/methylene tetrahydromethanopterin reductase-like flavin-dependent oxidoreductase (luciferase family)